MTSWPWTQIENGLMVALVVLAAIRGARRIARPRRHGYAEHWINRNPYAIAGEFFLAVLVSAIMVGGMLRNELSPWVWRQFPIEHARHGMGAAVFLAIAYLVFYASAGFLPYCVLRSFMWIRFLHPTENAAATDAGAIRGGLRAFGLASGLLLIGFLDAEVAFLRAIPTDALGGVFLIGALAAAAYLAVGASKTLRGELAKLRAVVPHNTFVVCKCSKCDHEWALRARDVEDRWNREGRRDHNHPTVPGGYPLK